MKKLTGSFRLLQLLIPAVAFLMMSAGRMSADIISPDRVINWIPGVTVGVSGGMRLNRNNLIDVTKSPYNADNTGATDATTAIQTAINNAPANSVVYLPTGRYLLNSSIYCQKSDITIRGDGPTKTIVVTYGTFSVGQNAANYRLTPTDFATTGGAKGSTTLTLSNAPTFGANSLVLINATVEGSDNLEVIGLGIPSFKIAVYDLVTSVSGNTVTLANPLPFDLTNNTSIINLNPYTYQRVGIEHLTLTATNSANGTTGRQIFVLQFDMTANCWMYDCDITWACNYNIMLANACNIQLEHCRLSHAQGAGSNHSGLLTSASFSLIEDNIFSDGLQPAIEFNGPASGNAYFGNFFTNNLSDIDEHGPHPLMNLWEQNLFFQYPVVTSGVTNFYGGGFELDGYFGSCSHQTLFRNNITSSYGPVYLKRWSSYCSIVGNVLGSSGVAYSAFVDNGVNNQAHQIIELGRPNIGNSTFNGTTAPIPWNYPGGLISAGVANGTMVFTKDQINTNILLGDFSNVPGGAGALIFQDPDNTNVYWPKDGISVNTVGAGTATSIMVNRNITVSNGWRAFFVSQLSSCYQQRITNNISTHVITGNYDYYNNALTWDANGAQTLPTSYLYANGAPIWWGTNRWPAVQPDATPLVTTLPAEARYLGIETLAPPPSGNPAPPSQLKAIAPSK